VGLVRPLGDYFAVGTLTSNTAHAVALSGAFEEARSLMEPVVQSLDTAREADVIGFMVTWGLIHLWEGDLDEAVLWFEKGVERLGDRGRDWTAARSLPGLVGALRRLGRTEKATLWARRGVRQLTAFGGWYECADVLDEQGRLLAEDDPPRARDLHVQALVLRRDHGIRLGYPDSLDALARLAAEAGDTVEAARLCAAGEAARSAMGYPRRPVDRAAHEALIGNLRASAGEASFRAAWDEGAAADPDVLVAALTRGRGPRSRAPGPLGALSPTELDIARLVSDGLSNPQIAARLYMSRGTVKAHLARIFTKLGMSNRTELAAFLRSETDGG
jgi:DNA-binding NarL/FixJ family response regulator